MPHRNAKAIETGYKAFGAGDMETVASLLDENCEWVNGGNNEITGTYHGREAILEMFAKIGQVTNNSFRTEVNQVVANNAGCATSTTVTGEAGGETVTVECIDCIEMKDGKITHWNQIPTSWAALNKIFSA